MGYRIDRRPQFRAYLLACNELKSKIHNYRGAWLAGSWSEMEAAEAEVDKALQELQECHRQLKPQPLPPRLPHGWVPIEEEEEEETLLQQGGPVGRRHVHVTQESSRRSGWRSW